METPTGALDVPEFDLAEARREWQYRGSRRASRRRQLLVITLVLMLGTGYVGRKVGSHLLASWWMEANGYRIAWEVDGLNWSKGGATSVRATARYGALPSELARADLKFLPWLGGVEEVDLSTLNGLTDADLSRLDELAGLKSLEIDRTRSQVWPLTEPGILTDATLVRVSRLTRLRRLNFSGHRITDAGLAHLANLSELEHLDLRQTAITDRGLGHLKALPRLKSLDLTGTRVTAEGVRDFEADRPGVTVEADPPPAPEPKEPSKP